MSDGNFNRSLLPHTPYHSGLQTGKAMTKMKAAEAFREFIGQEFPHLSPAELDEKTTRFKTLLSHKI